jgi:ArsR family transcriptional regulator
MSNQELPVVNGVGDGCCAAEPDGEECCAPLASEPLSDAWAEDLAPLFKAVGDPVRLRLLSLIACHDGRESCVCDLTDAFDVTGPAVSYHLRILREAGLISSERRGTWVYYRVNPQAMARMSAVLVPGPALLASANVNRRLATSRRLR